VRHGFFSPLRPTEPSVARRISLFSVRVPQPIFFSAVPKDSTLACGFFAGGTPFLPIISCFLFPRAIPVLLRPPPRKKLCTCWLWVVFVTFQVCVTGDFFRASALFNAFRFFTPMCTFFSPACFRGYSEICLLLNSRSFTPRQPPPLSRLRPQGALESLDPLIFFLRFVFPAPFASGFVLPEMSLEPRCYIPDAGLGPRCDRFFSSFFFSQIVCLFRVRPVLRAP